MALIRSLLLAALFACTAWAGVSVHTNDVLALDPAAHPITLQAGAEHRYTITATQSGTPIDLTGLTGLWTVTDPRDAAALITWTGTLVNASAGVIRFSATPPATMEQGVTYEGHARAYLGTSLVSLIAHDYMTLAGAACSTCSVSSGSGSVSLSSTVNVYNVVSAGPTSINGIVGGAVTIAASGPGLSVTTNSGTITTVLDPAPYAQQGGSITGSTLTVGGAVITGLGTTNIAVGGVRAMLEGEASGGGASVDTNLLHSEIGWAGAGATVTANVWYGPDTYLTADSHTNINETGANRVGNLWATNGILGPLSPGVYLITAAADDGSSGAGATYYYGMTYGTNWIYSSKAWFGGSPEQTLAIAVGTSQTRLNLVSFPITVFPEMATNTYAVRIKSSATYIMYPRFAIRLLELY